MTALLLLLVLQFQGLLAKVSPVASPATDIHTPCTTTMCADERNATMGIIWAQDY